MDYHDVSGLGTRIAKTATEVNPGHRPFRGTDCRILTTMTPTNHRLSMSAHEEPAVGDTREV